MKPAPFFADLAEGPAKAHGLWLKTSDDVRIRIGVWPDGDAGTVLLFPGRTEFVEKYGRLAGDFGKRGFASIAVDWRGQGLADRVSSDPDMGHVAGSFLDYQRDVEAVIAAVKAERLPKPYYVVGHSMGGAIALRTLLDRNDIAAAAFSAPMWGIQISAALRPIAWSVPRVARAIGQGEKFAPGTPRDSYLATAAFEGNTLTTDPQQFAFMQRQTQHDSRFALGGPSLHWLHEALEECRALSSVSLPSVPALAAVGSDESIVDQAAIRTLADRWPECVFRRFDGAQHELLMERPEVRDVFISDMADLFLEHGR
jgi:lysophospholipase